MFQKKDNDKSQNPKPQVTNNSPAQEDDLQLIISELNQKLEEANEKYLRLQADYINFKQRTEKNMLEIHNMASEDFAMDLLPCMDILQKAKDSIPEDLISNNWVMGVLQLYNLFQKFFELRNIKIIEIKLGETEFDPNFHEALMQEPNDNKNKILEIFQDGYMIGDKVLRPSKVKVSV